MPVFNGAGFLRRSVGSLRAQTLPEWELLAVNDGSTDGSLALLSELAATDPRVKVMSQPNRGVSAARNRALAVARADWIAYLDCDDEFYPAHLASVVENASESGPDVLVYRYEMFDERPRSPTFGELWIWNPEEHFTELAETCVSTPVGVVHRRVLIDRVGGFDESLVTDEDSDLWRRFAAAGVRFAFVHHPSGLYHLRSGSHSRTRTPPTGK
jgi:glycosyltransferase involved in cell wall biosynthesis